MPKTSDAWSPRREAVGEGPGLLLVEVSGGDPEEVTSVCASFTPDYEWESPRRVCLALERTTWVNGSPGDCAPRIRRRLGEVTGGSVTACLAFSRWGARVGLAAVGPGGYLVLGPGKEREAAFLRAQSLTRLPGLGDRLVRRLEGLGIETLGTFADLTLNEVSALAGAAALGPWRRARGEEAETAPRPRPPIPVLRREELLVPPTNAPRLLAAATVRGVSHLGHDLRTRGRSAGLASLELGFRDGMTTVVEATHPGGLHLDDDLIRGFLSLLDRALGRRIQVSRVVLTLGQLSVLQAQGDFFPSPTLVQRRRLQPGLDAVRRKFGPGALLVAAGFPGRGDP